MAIEDELYRAFTGRTRPTTESFADMLSEAKDRHGSVRGAARAYGVPESSWRRWAKGARPKAASMEKVTRGARSDRMIDGAPSKGNLTIKARDRHDGRERTLTADRLKLRPGTVERVRDAYLRGDDKAAARELLAGIGDRWYREWLTPGSVAAKTGTMDESGGGPEGAARRERERRDHAEQSGAPSSGGGTSGGGASGWGEDDYDDGDYDWQDLIYEGDDYPDSDYGAGITGVGA